MGYKRGIHQDSLDHESAARLSRKAQVSVFLTIAVVLLMLIGGFFLIRNYFDRETFSTDLSDPSLTPVQKYVLGCIDQTLRTGVEIAAAQGGYIELPREISLNARMYVSPHPQAPLKAPVWFAASRSYVPTSQQVEQQLASFIDNAIGNCLQDLEPVQDIADIRIASAPLSQVSLNDKDIAVKLNYSVSYTVRDKTLSQDEFSFVLAAPLKSMIDEARIVATQINDEQLLEYATINLMSAADPLIPLSGMNLSCQRPTWRVEDVRANIEQVLYQMIPRIRVTGAEGIPFSAPDSSYASLQRITPDDFSEPAIGSAPIKQKVPRGYANAPEDSYEYNHLRFEVPNADTLEDEGYTIGFAFQPSYGLDMEVRPQQNGILSGTAGQGSRDFLRFLCLQVYHFTYDILYPVEISVVKENVFRDGAGLTLKFAMPVQIQRNLPNKDTFGITTLADTPGGQLCENPLDYRTRVEALDLVTGEPIKDAEIEFHCYKYSCPLGKTNTAESFNPQLITAIPSFCSGGSVVATHPQYIEASHAFYDAPQEVRLEMWPLKNVTFSVEFGPNPQNRARTALGAQLTQNQQAVVQLESNNIDYQTYAAYNSDTSASSTLQLIGVGGQYNVTVLVYETTDGEDAMLAGAYKGTLSVSTSALSRKLTLYAYDYGQLVQPEDVAERIAFVENDEIVKARFAPAWS